MKILITGATGFIGSRIVNFLLETKHEIIALAMFRDECLPYSNIEWLIGDISDISAIEERIKNFNPEILIHLAWEGIPNFNQDISLKNLMNSIYFLDRIISITNCRRFLISGSSFEYGNQRGICRENDSLTPNSYFSWAKHALQKWIELKASKEALNFIWFRLFFVYGYNQRKESLIPTLVKAFMRNEKPNIINPFNENDYIFVDDIAEAFYLAVEKKIPSGIYNLGRGERTSVYEISKIIETIITGTTRISDEIYSNALRGTFSSFYADMTATRSAFSWLPPTSLQEGIKKYYLSVMQ